MTTDILTYDGILKAGPDLPVGLLGSCAVDIGPSVGMIAAGERVDARSNARPRGDAFKFDFELKAWTKLASMRLARSVVACSKMTTQSQGEVVVVIGGKYDQ